MTFEERERARNELYHYGVKGMKWDKTKRKIRGAYDEYGKMKKRAEIADAVAYKISPTAKSIGKNTRRKIADTISERYGEESVNKRYAKKMAKKAVKSTKKGAVKAYVKGGVKYVKAGGDARDYAKAGAKAVKKYASAKNKVKKAKKKIKKLLKGD